MAKLNYTVLMSVNGYIAISISYTKACQELTGNAVGIMRWDEKVDPRSRMALSYR